MGSPSVAIGRFYPALTRARLRQVTFHSLRHSCASAMIADGAAIIEVQNQLAIVTPRSR